jgi:O-antigen/teichoic acid export membrane protein
MGKITRHGISSSIFMYLGLILGFINATILFPKFLGKEVYGFCQFLIQMSEMMAVFSLLGMQNVTIRFFSRFRDRANQHDGYFSCLAAVVGLGTIVSTFLLILLRPLFIDWFGDGRSGPFIEQFYWGLIVMFIFTNVNSVFASYANALQRPRVPTFLFEVAGRLITLTLILVFIFQWIDRMEFIALYSLKLIPITLGLVLFIHLIGELHFRINLQIFRRPVFKEMLNYGSYAIFAQIGGRLVNRIDMIMIGALLSWGEVGIYSVFFFLSVVITMPHDGMGRIVNPMIAEYWQLDQPQKVAELYRRMALNNWAPAVLIFAGILANLENAVLLLGEDYRPGTTTAVFLGIAQLGHVVNGYNGMVLVHSKLYRFDLVFKLITAVITVVTNYLFIKWMGLTGAAVATALTILLRNVLVQLFVHRRLHMHPFSKPMIYVALIGLPVLAIGLGLPRLPGHFAWDILVRSGLMTVVFGGLLIGFNVAPDITEYFWKIIAEIRRRVKGS